MSRASRLRHLVSLLRPYRVRVALMFVALVLATGAALAPPYLAGLAIDDGIKTGDTKALTMIVLAFLAAALINWGATYAQTFLINWVGQRALQDLRIELFQHLQRLSIGFYSRNKAGVLISRLTNDVQALDQLVTDGISTLFSATLTLVGTAVILVLLDVNLAMITFLTFPVLLVASVAFRLASAGAYALTRVKIAQFTAYLQETLSGVRVVRAFGQEERHKSQFAELNDEYREANMKTVYLSAAYFPAVELLSAVATAAILKITLPIRSSGNVRKVTSARVGSRANRITVMPSSVSVDEKSVCMPSVTSWSSACTSLVSREISTPALLRE